VREPKTAKGDKRARWGLTNLNCRGSILGMKRTRDEHVPHSLTEAIAHLMALPVDSFDTFSPRTIAEKIAVQIIRDATMGNADSLAAVIRIALNEKSKPKSNQTKITVIEE